MKISLTFIFLLLLATNSYFSQEVYPDYQDGVLIFQLKTQETSVIKSKDKLVDFKKVPFLNELSSKYGIQEVKQLYPNHKSVLLARTYQVEFSQAASVLNFAKDLEKNSKIEYAERKELHHSTYTPNDQYNVNSVSSGVWGMFQINAEQAWDISTGNASTVIAVVDNAIDINHPDLVNKLVAGHDAVDSDNDPSPCGTNSGLHGTHVSGTAAAETDNTIGVPSVSFNCSLMPVKIGNCNGSLTAGYEGIIWATDNGADVINMSWGGSGSSTYGQNVCNYAWNNGSILIAAAGNDNVSSVFYPAGYNNVVSVASTAPGDVKSGFSNYGSWIDIAAPGSSILSCQAGGTSYQILQGTSMASPLVSSLVGLMKSHALSATNTDILNCLYSSAANIDGANSGYVGQLGAGRIDAYQAMVCANAYTLALDASITTINAPLGNICSATFVPEVVLRNLGSTTITSATITYQVSGSAAQTYNWTGSLASTQNTIITLPSVTSTAGAYTFTATVSNPNSGTDQNTANDSQTSNFTVIPSGEQVTLTILTDCYGSEVTWDIIDASSNVMASGGPYADVVGGQNEVETICLANGCYTFNIYDSYGDGLNGAIASSCSVNGNYNMVDASNNILFQMAGTTGAYGSGTSHTFCLSSPNTDDAGISAITSPQGVFCNTSIVPVVVIQNFGNITMTSAIINYQLGSGTIMTYNWTGSLAPNGTASVTLPAMTAVAGTQTFNAYTTMPNGNTDMDASNDANSSTVNVVSTGLPLPFIEDFETSGFTNQNWTISNPDNSKTWEIATVVGTSPGNTAAKLDYYQYAQNGQRDQMTSVPIDFSGQSAVTMTFEHAYRRYDQNTTDSLIILISTDCGATYTRVFQAGENSTGTFATAATNTSSFTPSQTDDWCMGPLGASCFSINLDSYAGQSSVLVRFESYNAGTTGNNLFIDNINISGVPAANCPTIASVPTNVSCYGLTDGTITINATGGVTPLQYSIDGATFGSSNTFNGLPQGTYTAYVKGADGCQDIETIVITEPTALTQTNTPTNESCAGNDGGIAISGLGGTGSLMYSINNGSITQNTGVFINLTAGTYQVIVSDANGCSSTMQSVTLTAGSSPTGTEMPANETCNAGNGSITVTAANGQSPYSYSIDGGSTFQNTGTFNGLTAGNYAIVIQDASGCNYNNNVNLMNIGGAYTMTVSADQTICSGNSANLTASGVTVGGSYAWDNGLGSGTFHNVSPTVTTTYSVTGTDSYGCSQTASTTVTVNNIPTVSVTSTNDTICAGESVTLIASGAQTYVWNTGGSSANLTVTPTTQTTYSVIGQNGSCAAAPVLQTVMVNPSPTIVMGANTATIPVGGTVNFNNSGSSASSYLWDFGDGQTATSGNTSHTYNVQGAYVVTLTGSIGDCEVTEQITIQVGDPIGINEVDFADLVQVYPNPTKGLVTIKINNAQQDVEVYILDLIGKQITTTKTITAFNSETISFDLNEMSNGVYLVMFKTEGQSLAKRLIITK